MSRNYLDQVSLTIAPEFLRRAEGSYITCLEPQTTKKDTVFRIRVSSKMAAFSLDQPTLNPFQILQAGRNCRNDLILITLGPENRPLAFVIELKDSKRTRNAQQQIESGSAFCHYLDEIISLYSTLPKKLACYGVLVYRPKSRSVGLTRPQFLKQGKHNILRADYSLDADLSLSVLVKAVTT